MGGINWGYIKIWFEWIKDYIWNIHWNGGGGGEGGGLTVCVTTDKQKRVSVYTPASVLNST